ncbi:MAG: hypothetical protein IFK94_03350 [Acidobacteria bacterium]|uniref:Lipoprotein n=1 Tax=Candidatus Polarisedimenticola svalbardensis TaxID=2886004 RepID=A0A8J7CKG1_9BACT|nr:hypothetical protein [Candidatus Polarisedimenticola svalbardensis]
MSSVNRIWAAFALVAVTALSGCGPKSGEVEQAIRDYCAAVQNEDLEQLTCLSTGAAATDPDQFHAWVESQYSEYLAGRDLGNVDVESGGIAMVKTFSIGHGTYYTVEQIRAVGDQSVEAILDLTFGYGSIDLSGLLPGTTFYVAGTPPGRVYGIVVPRYREQVEREVLTSMQLVWTLVRQPGEGGCDPAWTVHSVEAIEGSASTTRLEWLF